MVSKKQDSSDGYLFDCGTSTKPVLISACLQGKTTVFCGFCSQEPDVKPENTCNFRSDFITYDRKETC